MANGKKSRFAGLLAALLRRRPSAVAEPEPVPEPAGPGPRELHLQSRVAELEMELRERDQRIAQMRREYADLEASKQRAAAGAKEDELERLFKRLAGTLASLSALSAFAREGQQVETDDLLGLVGSVEKDLARAGLEPVGRVGQTAAFDVGVHQRMSGGAVHAGTPVTVQLPGYRFGDRVLLKAMVSAAEDTQHKEFDDG